MRGGAERLNSRPHRMVCQNPLRNNSRQEVTFISHRLAVHLYLQLKTDVDHPKHILQTYNYVFVSQS